MKRFYVENESFMSSETALAVANARRRSLLAHMRHKKMKNLPRAFARYLAARNRWHTLSSMRKAKLESLSNALDEYAISKSQYEFELKQYDEYKARLYRVNDDITLIRSRA